MIRPCVKGGLEAVLSVSTSKIPLVVKVNYAPFDSGLAHPPTMTL
jgi:hypothetical protein